MSPRWLLLFGACAGPPPTAESPVEPGPPLVDSLTVTCDADANRWTLVLETTAWTGGVTTDWTVDGAYLERHDLDGIAFAEDGTFERLRLRASIVTDFRKSGPERTAFTCSDDPDILLVVTDLDGIETDCRAIGPTPSRWASLPKTGDCDEVWVIPK